VAAREHPYVGLRSGDAQCRRFVVEKISTETSETSVEISSADGPAIAEENCKLSCCPVGRQGGFFEYAIGQ